MNQGIEPGSEWKAANSGLLLQLRRMLLLFIPLVVVFLCFASARELANKEPAGKGGETAQKAGAAEKSYGAAALRKVSVVVDPGHGGEDWGTHHGDIREKDLNLDIALRLGELLEKKNVKVIYTRKEDVFTDLHQRPETANAADAALFISVHNNRMPGDPDFKGTETLYSSASNRQFSRMNDKRLAELVQGELVKRLGTDDNGIRYRPELAVLHLTEMPAIIAEIGYISNSSDRARLDDPSFRQEAAQALCDGAMKALEEMGAFRDKEGEWVLQPEQPEEVR